MLFRVFTFGAVGVISAYIAWPFTEGNPPVSVIRSEAVNSPVQPGGELKIQTTVRRWKSCPSQVDRLIYDGENTRFPLDDEEFKASPGPMGEETFNRSVTIPMKAARGHARYVVITAFTCNWTHRWFGPLAVISPEVRFEIAGPPLPIQIPGAR